VPAKATDTALDVSHGWQQEHISPAKMGQHWWGAEFKRQAQISDPGSLTHTHTHTHRRDTEPHPHSTHSQTHPHTHTHTHTKARELCSFHPSLFFFVLLLPPSTPFREGEGVCVFVSHQLLGHVPHAVLLLLPPPPLPFRSRSIFMLASCQNGR
jgi:hypothetical protein